MSRRVRAVRSWYTSVRSLLLDRTRLTRKRYRHGYWKSIFATPEYEKSFGPFELRTYHRRIPATTQLVVDRVLSKSFITALEEEEQREVLQEVKRVVEKGDGKVWIDQEAGTFGELRYWA